MALISFAASIRRRLRAVRSTPFHRDAGCTVASLLAEGQPALDERHIRGELMSNICPYTGEHADNFTDEHIIPHALGGSNGYTIRASDKANNDLGTRVDAALINSQLIQALRLKYGIRSRSGEPEWRMRGKLKPSGTDADIIFKSDGTVEQRIRKPVKKYEKDHASLILGPDETEDFLNQFIKGQNKKGRK